MFPELQYNEDGIKNITTLKQECLVLLSLVDTIKNDKSWEDDTKDMVIDALTCGIGAMVVVDGMIKKEDDLK